MQSKWIRAGNVCTMGQWSIAVMWFWGPENGLVYFQESKFTWCLKFGFE